MKLVLAGLVLVLVVGAQAQWYTFSRKSVRFTKEVIRGSRDMWRAYSDMKEANWKNSDYFHARSNYAAAKRGPGRRRAAEVISDVLQSFLGSSGRGHKDTAAAQRANGWAHNGGDPKHYRRKALPIKY
ncbi:serum amyloid A [Brienomyrus brachyistius]|uniref:serum amyloid A n=1 Tax=Brienomyrus brachyistius TaxID=42636 RepID=UPI0020B419AF|nr:serum amyloid A [Brienomyrus brachyistius]